MAICSSFTYQKCGLSISYVSLLEGKLIPLVSPFLKVISFCPYQSPPRTSLRWSSLVFQVGYSERLKWSRIVKNDGGLMKYWNYTEGI